MTSGLKRIIWTAAFTCTAFAAAAQEEATNRVAAATDWSVFEESDPRECFGVSAPKEQLNTRDGEPVEVRRGETLLFCVLIRPKPERGRFMVTLFTGGLFFDVRGLDRVSLRDRRSGFESYSPRAQMGCGRRRPRTIVPDTRSNR